MDRLIEVQGMLHTLPSHAKQFRCLLAQANTLPGLHCCWHRFGFGATRVQCRHGQLTDAARKVIAAAKKGK